MAQMIQSLASGTSNPVPTIPFRIPRLPLTRDQLMMLMMAINLLFLALDTWLAHQESGNIVMRERIPIIFGLVAGVLLLFAGLIAISSRSIASIIATATLVAAIGVGALGAYYHILRAALPAGPISQRLTLDLLIWAPPALGPLAFAMVGVLGISAAWVETPYDSGTLHIFGKRYLHLPYSKTRAYFFIVGMGMVAALVSSALDHARTGYVEWSVWFASAVGIFGMVTAIAIGSIERPSRLDLNTYIFAMLLLVLAGPIGAWFHIQADLATGNAFVLERFLRGAPVLAPLLYTNMGLLGLIALIEKRQP